MKKTLLRLNDKDEYLFKSNSLFKNKEIYSSYYMSYLLMEEASLLKLAVANYLFDEAKALLKVFKLGQLDVNETLLNQLFTTMRLNGRKELLEKNLEGNIEKVQIMIEKKLRGEMIHIFYLNKVYL